MTHLRFVSAALLTASCLAVGCSGGLPSEEWIVDGGGDADGNAAGSAGKGGAAGSAGTAGKGGSAGKAGTGGSGGTSTGGSAGKAGTGGSAGTAGTGGTGGAAGTAGTGGLAGSDAGSDAEAGAGSAGTAGTGGQAGADAGPLCVTGDRRCVGKELQTCGGTPESWQPTETCASAALCLDGLAADAGACASPTCAVDQYQCVGQFMQKCNPSQTGWVALGQCATLELCQSGLATGQCTAPVCDTNQKQCTGKAMEKCKAGRDGWELLSTCETPELCADGLAGGQCVLPLCDVGQSQCSGDQLSLMTCNAGRNGWNSQSCTYGCFLDAAVSYCGACSPGSHQCSGAAYQTCNAKGKWEDTTSCGALEQCALGPQSQMLCVAKLVSLPGNHAIDATEVTRAQYAAWLATNPAPTGLPAVCSANSSYTPDATCMAGGGVCQGTGCAKHPQVCIEWCDAYAYCKSVGKRLCGKIGGGPADHTLYMDPTHDAWFASCTAAGVNQWPYGNSASATNCNIASGMTIEVGTKPACISTESSYQGTFDLSGNVWEWEDSCTGTASGDDFCRIRGGAFRPCFWNSVNNDACDYPYNADRCDYGAQLKRKLHYYDTGFRCCSL